jgi:outer membrane receptor protein involved in Fe transport
LEIVIMKHYLPLTGCHAPALLAIVLCCLAGPAQAEIDAIELPLEALGQVRIISAPKFADNPDAIPSVVSILRREDIRRYGWRTLGDALRTLQGFNVTNDHTYGYAGVRGISPAGDYRPRLQLLIDGLAVNENIYAGAPVDSTLPIDLDLVERIEVVRGPSASVYGSDALFGVINVVTRSGQSVGGGEAGLTLASGADRRLRLSLGGDYRDADVLVSATGFNTGGRSLDFPDVGAVDRQQRAHSVGAEDGGQFFLRARGSDWRLTLIHSERKRTVPTGSYGTIFDDDGHFETDRYTLAEIAKDWRIDASHQFYQRFYLGEYGYDADFPYDESPLEPRLINRDRARGNWWGLENRLVSHVWLGHRLTLGLEYRADTRQDQLNDDRGYGCFQVGTAPCLDDRRSSHQFTVYLQDEFKITAATGLTLGVRHDDLSGEGSFFSPRLGVVHDAGGLGVFKALYGSAFRAPSVYERHYRTPSYPYGNPAVDSEKMSSLDLSWEKSLGPRSRLTTALYAFKVRNLISIETGGLASNGSAVDARGLEVEYQREWGTHWQIRTGFSSQRASDDRGRMDNSPQHMVKFNLAMPTGIPALLAGLEGQWVSARRAFDGSERIADYAIANLNLRYAPAGVPWSVALGIYNLADHRYEDPVAIDDSAAVPRWRSPQFGRSLALKATVNF